MNSSGPISSIPEEIKVSKDWGVLDAYVRANPTHLSQHHLLSYDYLYQHDLYDIIAKNNPIIVQSRINTNHKCIMYMGSKNQADIKNGVSFSKPIIYNGNESTFMFPSTARMDNKTYALTIKYDLVVEFYNGNSEPEQEIIKDIFLCDLPIMIKSAACILHDMKAPLLRACGEDALDPGGYFIIDGAEKVLYSLDESSTNAIIVQWGTSTDEEDVDEDDLALDMAAAEELGQTIKESGPKYILKAKIDSRSDDPSVAKKALVVQLDRDLTRGLTVKLPHMKENIPLFIVFRALGIFISDKEILEHILLCPVAQATPHDLDFFDSSIKYASGIHTQQMALTYMSKFTDKSVGNIKHVMQILGRYMLPHIGSIDKCLEKSLFMGYMAMKLSRVYNKIEVISKREHLQYRRVATSGILIGRLLNEYLKLMKTNITRGIDKRLFSLMSETKSTIAAYKRKDAILTKGVDKPAQGNNADQNNYNDFKFWTTQLLKREIFEADEPGRDVDEGIRKGFKGDWGSKPHTKIVGILHPLSRQTNLGFISDLRQVEQKFPKDQELEMLKIPGPHLQHGSQYGYYDPTNTSDGTDTGLNKSLAFLTQVTRGYPSQNIIDWINNNLGNRYYNLRKAVTFKKLHLTKVMVNGLWIGISSTPILHLKTMQNYRRYGMIPIFTSIAFNIRDDMLVIWTDAGRLTRPLWFKENIFSDETDRRVVNPYFTQLTAYDQINDPNMFDWNRLISGKYVQTKYASSTFNYREETIFMEPVNFKEFPNHGAYLEMIDSAEAEHLLIRFDMDLDQMSTVDLHRCTHMELHASTKYGVLTNNVMYLDYNPCVRVLIAAKHNKQGIGRYHSEYFTRMDKNVFVLEFGDVPLVKSRYLKYVNEEQRPYGENCFVAILSTSGYNVEDALCMNEDSLARGMFMTTRYCTYEFTESMEIKHHHEQNKTETFSIVTKTCLIPWDNLSIETRYRMDPRGIIMIGTIVKGNTPLLYTETTLTDKYGVVQKRVTDTFRSKRIEMAVVDEVYVSAGEIGTRVIKIRLREMRMPEEGDKFASREGQKGVLGRIIKAEDMPFMACGTRPDIIMNPHAYPSRETLGQLYETTTAFQSMHTGFSSDGTAYSNTKKQMEQYSIDLATACGYSSLCAQVMYCPETGRAFPTLICMGVNYYLRLQQMVEDKVSFRQGGPIDKLTRQPVDGRASGGGLKIGDMEALVLLAHGAAETAYDALMRRSDKFEMGVCNKTGTVAIFNPAEKKFRSLGVDGPPTIGDAFANKCTAVMNGTSRSFSRVEIPWCFRLLQMELQTCGITMRIITDSNITRDLSDIKWMREIREQKMAATMKALKSPNELPDHILFGKKPSLIDRSQLMSHAKSMSNVVPFVNLRYDATVDSDQKVFPNRAPPVFASVADRQPFEPFSFLLNPHMDDDNNEIAMDTEEENDTNDMDVVNGGTLNSDDDYEVTNDSDDDDPTEAIDKHDSDVETNEETDQNEKEEEEAKISDEENEVEEANISDEEESVHGGKKRKLITRKCCVVEEEDTEVVEKRKTTKPKKDKKPLKEIAPRVQPKQKQKQQLPLVVDDDTNSVGAVKDFVKGEIVLFNNDFIPTRIWRVRDVGEKMVTIETLNPKNLSPAEMVQVVVREYIQRPSDIPADAPVTTRPGAIANLAAQALAIQEQLAAAQMLPVAPVGGIAPPTAPVNIRIVNQPNQTGAPPAFQHSSKHFQ